MPQSKQQGSAARRRAQARKQRVQTPSKSSSSSSSRRNKRQRSRNNPWLLVGGIVVMVIIVVGVFIYLANQPKTSSTTATKQSNSTFQQLTSISTTELSEIGAGSAQSSLKALPANTAMLKGPTGKPEFFYAGAEYCPYCAAQRWAMIVALSRFGTFNHPLSELTSSEDNVPTYTFVGMNYSSKYIDFVAVETVDNNQNTLQTPTAEQEQLVSTYDAPPYTTAQNKGSIPFLMIGNKAVSAGSYYLPDVLFGKSNQDVVNQLKDPNSDIARSVLGSANILTAEICQISQGQPTNVCSSPTIQQIQQTLPKAAASPATSQGGLASGPMDVAVRKQD